MQPSPLPAWGLGQRAAGAHNCCSPSASRLFELLQPVLIWVRGTLMNHHYLGWSSKLSWKVRLGSKDPDRSCKGWPLTHIGEAPFISQKGNDIGAVRASQPLPWPPATTLQKLFPHMLHLFPPWAIILSLLFSLLPAPPPMLSRPDQNPTSLASQSGDSGVAWREKVWNSRLSHTVWLAKDSRKGLGSWSPDIVQQRCIPSAHVTAH